MKSTTMGFREFVALMAMMMSLTALSIDAVLPALEIVGQDLGIVKSNDGQLIISVLFFGIAIGQLFYGPISDSVGRKKPLYWGLSIFILGSILSIVATSLEVMLLGRFIQGIGLASPRTVSLAMIRDQYVGAEMARVMSFIMMIFILVPILAPAVGQGILFFFEWRVIFIVLLFVAAIVLIWFWTRMRETLVEEKRTPFSLKRIGNSMLAIAKTPQSLLYTVIAGLIAGAFIGFLNSSRQIFQDQYGLGEQFPLYFASLAFSLGVASFFNGKLVMRFGTHFMVKLAMVALISIALVFLWVSAQYGGALPLELAMIYLVSTLFCEGILFGNLNSMAMEPLGDMAGIGAAVVGFLSTLISAFLGTMVGAQYDGTLWAIIAGFAVLGTVSLILMLTVNHFIIDKKEAR